MSEDPCALWFASGRIARQAVVQDPRNINYMPPPDNLACVLENNLLLQYVTSPFLVTRVVQQDGMMLQHASLEMRGDPGIVMQAVNNDGLALEHAGQGPKNDEAIVMAAVRCDWRALQHASDRMKNDRLVVEQAIRLDGEALQYASEEMRHDPAMVHYAKQHLRTGPPAPSVSRRAPRPGEDSDPE